MLGKFKFIFVLMCLMNAANAWAAKIESIPLPKYKNLKALVEAFEMMSRDPEMPWAPETYGQQLVVRLTEKAEGENWQDILQEVVRSHLTHTGEDYQASVIDIHKTEKSLVNLQEATDHMFTYGSHITPEKLTLFSEIFRAALFRRPHRDLHLLIEGNDRGECRGVIILDRRYSEAIVLGSCQLR